MATRWSRAVAGVVVGGGACLLLAAGPAAADAIDPPGSCFGAGNWDEAGLDETSEEHSTDDVIKIPRADTVLWEGNIEGFDLASPEGPRREISGEVQLDLPIGSVTVDDWGGSSERYANAGEHEYDLPSVLVGIKMKLHGEHREEGARVCGGSVYVEIEGDTFENPLTIASLIGLVVSGGSMIAAGWVKKLWAVSDKDM